MLNTYVKNKQQSNWDKDYANISITSNINGNKTLIDIELDNEDLANILKIPSVVTPIDKRLKMDFFGSFKREPRFLQIKMPRIETPYVPPIKPCLVETILPLNDTMLPLNDIKGSVNDAMLPLLETKLPLNDVMLPLNDVMLPLTDTLTPLNDAMLPLNYKKQKNNSYLSSPLPDEELIAPISILNKPINNYTLTPHKRHKTHKTYKVYKKHKSSSRRIKKSNSKPKTSKPYYASL